MEILNTRFRVVISYVAYQIMKEVLFVFRAILIGL